MRVRGLKLGDSQSFTKAMISSCPIKALCKRKQWLEKWERYPTMASKVPLKCGVVWEPRLHYIVFLDYNP